MKIGAFITTIVLIIGTALEVLLFSRTFGSSGASYAQMITAIQTSSVAIFIIVPYLGMILLFVFSMGSKKVMMIIGSILGILGLGAQLIGIMTATGTHIGIYSTFYVLGSFVLVLGGLLYFIGCIQYRKQSKLGVISGFLLFFILLISNFIVSYLLIEIDVILSPNAETISLIMALWQMIIFVFHGFVYSFSKKKDGSWDDGAEDTMSVESGDAFASYVPSGKSKKEKTKKGKKKKGPKEDDDFIFDF